ncbi:MAG: helix-turn-helix domain-containing protein [Candidatus Lustribacter sp.]
MDLLDADPLGSQEQVAAVAARMSRGLAELASDIRSVVESAIPGLRDSNSDNMAEASVRQNLESVLGILARGGDAAGIEPPTAAVDQARRLAQRGVSTFALIRAYRLGQWQFLRRVIGDLVAHSSGPASEGRATLALVDGVSEYIDNVTEALLITYAREREEWLNPYAILRARVRSVLVEKTLDLASAQERLGRYLVRQNHLGAEVWVPDAAPEAATLTLLRELCDALAKAAECPDSPLFVALDEASAFIWLPLGTRARIERECLAVELMRRPGTFAALGEPESSLDGFRRTHEQAVSAALVARLNAHPPARAIWYADIAPIALMSANLDATRKWVAEALGPLAVDGERQAGLRETLRVFLANGSSYAATAKELGLHRNTAQYRVRTAEDMRGRPLREGRLDVELALLACRWFGAAVLAPAGQA